MRALKRVRTRSCSRKSLGLVFDALKKGREIQVCKRYTEKMGIGGNREKGTICLEAGAKPRRRRVLLRGMPLLRAKRRGRGWERGGMSGMREGFVRRVDSARLKISSNKTKKGGDIAREKRIKKEERGVSPTNRGKRS